MDQDFLNFHLYAISEQPGDIDYTAGKQRSKHNQRRAFDGPDLILLLISWCVLSE